jgi:hypothetical protein
MHTLHGSLMAILMTVAAAGLSMPASVEAGCGCQKPPPPRAAVRPFVGTVDDKVSIFNDALVVGDRYAVQFESVADGSVDWSRGRVFNRRDFADGQKRPQLVVRVPDVSLGPCRISVWRNDVRVFTLGEENFTVTSPAVALHDFSETIARDGYRAAVGTDGTVYFAVDVSNVNDATTFSATADGYPLTFDAKSVAMYNGQGFLMQLLDPRVDGLFQIHAGEDMASDTLRYWRHEFRTYKREHRQVDARRNDDDTDWHADGSYHVDHDRIVVAVSGLLADGSHPVPGATPPFRLTISSSPAPLATASAR